MREIKFRGKVKWNGQHFFSGDWIHGFYAYNELKDKHFILVERAHPMAIDSFFVEIEVEKETIGQYTGLKDKNGVEIYEGDIVQDINCDTYIIECDEEEARFILLEGNIMYGFCCFHTHKELEVIGNIHEVVNE